MTKQSARAEDEAAAAGAAPGAEQTPAAGGAQAAPEADPTALWSAASAGCSLLVIDHYSLGVSYEARCRPLARQILVIDDLADVGVHFHAVFDEAAGVQDGAVVAPAKGFADGVEGAFGQLA